MIMVMVEFDGSEQLVSYSLCHVTIHTSVLYLIHVI